MNGDPARSPAVLLQVSFDECLKQAEINPTVRDDLLHGAHLATKAFKHCELGSIRFKDDEKVVSQLFYSLARWANLAGCEVPVDTQVD